MNVRKEKKLYTAPRMSVLQMRGAASLLAGSDIPDDAPDVDDYDGEFGFVVKDADRKA